MKVHKVILQEEITLTGDTPFWCTGSVTLKPMPDGRRGIFWELPDENNPGKWIYKEIDWRIAKLSKFHNIYVEYRKYRLFICEHLLALRWLGLDSLAIRGIGYSPFFTTAKFWKKIKPHTRQIIEEEIPRFSLPRKYKLTQKKSGLDKMIRITPLGNMDTILKREIDYPQKGIAGECTEILTPELLERIFPVLPPGISPSYRLISKILHTKYHKNVFWPDQINKETCTKWHLDHSLTDILGELALISHDELPTGFFLENRFAGHAMGLEIVKTIGQERTVWKPEPALIVHPVLVRT